MMHEEGPSQEDIDRFSENETGYCPHCGEEIWDDSSQCPNCGEWLDEGTVHQNKIVRSFNKKFLVFIVVVVLVSFLWAVFKFF